MPDIIDIVHRIAYDVVDDGLKDVQNQLKKQLDTLEILGKRQIQLAQIYDKTSASDVAKREKAVQLMNKNKQAIEGVGNSLEKVVLKNKTFNNTLVQEQGIVGALSTKLDILRQRRDRATDQKSLNGYNRQIKETQAQLSTAQGAPKKGLLSGLTGGLGGVAKFLPAIAAGFSVVTLGKQIFDVTKKFEKYNAILKNTYQDSTQAAEAFEKIRSFAAATPYSVDELTQSFIKLKNRGFDPTTEELTKLGDLAASQGKSFDQLTEALLDGQSGEFERLKEFGIKAKTVGDNVTLSFKGVEKQIKKTDQEGLRNAILSFGTLQGVVGGMSAVSKTLEGKISNLGDSFDNLLATIGNSGGKSIFGGIIEGAASLLDTFQELIEANPADSLREQQREVNGLIIGIASLNEGEQARSFLISELSQKYPELIKYIDLEKLSNEQLLQVLDGINAGFERRIELAGQAYQQDKLNKQLIKQAEKYSDVIGSADAQEELKAAGLLDAFRAGDTKEKLRIAKEAQAKNIKNNFYGLGGNGSLFEYNDIASNLIPALERQLNLVPVLQEKQKVITKELAAIENRNLADFNKILDKIKAVNGVDVKTNTLTKRLNEFISSNVITEEEAGTFSELAGKYFKEISVKSTGGKTGAKTGAKGKQKSAAELALEKLSEQENAESEKEKQRFENQKQIQLQYLKDKAITLQEYNSFLSIESEKSNRTLLEIEEKYGKLKIKYQKTNDQEKTKTRLEQIESAYFEIDNRLKDIAEKEIQTAIDRQKQLNDELLSIQEEGLKRELSFIAEKYSKRRSELDKQEDAEKINLKIAEQSKNEIAIAVIKGNLAEIIRLRAALGKQEEDAVAAAKIKSYLSASDRFKQAQLDAVEQRYKSEVEAGNKIFLQKQAENEAEFSRLKATKVLDEQIESAHGKKKAKLIEQQGKEEAKLTRLKELAKLYIERDFANDKIARLEREAKTATGETLKGIEAQISATKAGFANLNDQIREGQKGLNGEDLKESRKATKEEYFQLGEAAAQAASTIISSFEQAADREIAIREKRTERAQKIADRGNAEALQIEERRLEQAQAIKEKYARQQVAINLVQQASALALAIAQAASLPFPTNLPAIGATITALAAGFASVKQLSADNVDKFADGVVEYRGKGTTRSDSNLVKISDRESVITAAGTLANKPILQAINKGAKFKLANPYVVNRTDGKADNLSKEFSEMKTELAGIKDAVKEKQPTTLIWDRRGIVSIVEEVLRVDAKKWKV